MLTHRTAQRLRVLSPALQSQNKLQQNKAQELKSSDFEGSRSDRWLRQGSGQHPLAGSPQHQRAFFIATGRPGERPAACCSGALAVLSGSGQSPGAGHHYSPRHISPCHILDHQDCDFGLGAGGAGGSALVIWVIWPSRNLIRSVALARSALSCFTSSLSMARASLSVARACFGAISASSGTLITHWLPTFCPVSNPLVNLRLTVFGETPRAFAASFIEYCIPKRVTHVSNPKPVFLGKPLPKVPMLGKCGPMGSVSALRLGPGRPVARSNNCSVFIQCGRK